jgi:WS/DGAT/MGAT family acyltransferase
VAHLIEQPLDPTRPLWELWVVEGVAGGRVAVVPKVSHVMADGMALLEFVLSVLDIDPDAAPPEPPPREAAPATPAPAGMPLLARALLDRSRRQVATAVGALAGLRRPARIMQWGAALARAAAGARPAPPAPITRPVGRHRDMTWFRQPMADQRRVSRAQGVSLNDVVLAAVAGALREVLGPAAPSGVPLHPRAIVPVSTHGATPGIEVENRFSLLLAELPVSVDDPVERLAQVHAEMVRRKQSPETSIGAVLLAVSDLVPAWLIRLVAPTILGRQPVVNLAVTNLPGTDEPLYLLGARLREAYPFVTVVGNIALIIGVVSYGGSLGVGITVDPDVVDDVDGLTAALDRSFTELIAAAGRRRTSPGPL